MTTRIILTEEERNALPLGAGDFSVRLARFKRFDDAAREIMRCAISAGDITDRTMMLVERGLADVLKAMPETLAEMTLYTLCVRLQVSGDNDRRGWPWARRTVHRWMFLYCEFSPYNNHQSPVSASWSEKDASNG
jgi:hypothetical protein